MGKSNIRSFRYSDEVAEIIEGFEGSSMNEKFENLVLYCSRAVPEKQKQLEQMDRQLELKRSELRKLQDRVVCVQSLVRSLESIKYQVDRLAVTQEE